MNRKILIEDDLGQKAVERCDMQKAKIQSKGKKFCILICHFDV